MEKQIIVLREYFNAKDYVSGVDLCESVEYGVEIYTKIAWGLGLTDSQYQEIENILDRFIDKDTYETYFSFDTSGYKHLVGVEVENNYLHIIVELKNNFEFSEDIKLEINSIINDVLIEVNSVMY